MSSEPSSSTSSTSSVAVSLARVGSRELEAREHPRGMRFAAVRCGLERRGLDLGLVRFEPGAVGAGTFTRNALRAHAVDRNAALLPGRDIRALVVNRGSGNALTGADGSRTNTGIAQAVAAAAEVPVETVLTASLGPVGVPLDLELVESACPALVADPHDAVNAFARIFTFGTGNQPEAVRPSGTPHTSETDDADPEVDPSGAWGHGDAWVATTEIVLAGAPVRFLALASAAGLSCLFTDANLAPERLATLLTEAVSITLDALAVDGVPGTSDMVLAFATGCSEAETDGHDVHLREAMMTVLRTLVAQLAAHGRGATRLLEVEVAGAPDPALARHVAHRVCRDEAVRLGVFGAQPCWPEVARAAGDAVAARGGQLADERLRITVQDVPLFDGRPLRSHRSGELNQSLKRPHVRWSLDLGQGDGRFVAYGCDLSFETVRFTTSEREHESRAGSGTQRLGLTGYTPRLTHHLLLEGLAYVRRFAGLKLLVHVASTLERRPGFVEELGRDLELCLDAGCKPVVAVPDHATATAVRQHMLASGHFASEDAGDPLTLVRLLDRGYLCILVRPTPDPHALVELALKLGIGKLVTIIGDQGLRDDHGVVQRLSPDTFLTGFERGRFDASDPDALVLARHAALQGVPALHVIDGRMHHALVGELFTDEGVGTLITRQALP